MPIQEFGREEHRTLSSLPQQPILRSSSRKRLLVSWWDREISVWRIARPRSKDTDGEHASNIDETKGRKFVAKIALQVDIGLWLRGDYD